MNTALFKQWLIDKGTLAKVASDSVSRLKRLDNALLSSNINSSIDDEYRHDNCKRILTMFSNNGKNAITKHYNLSSLPIGHACIHSYKLALVKYIDFKKEYPIG